MMEEHFVLTAYVELAPVAIGYYVSGMHCIGSFALADLGMCEPPSSSNVYCSDMSLLQDRYALSARSDADSDPEGVMTPERAVQLWSGQPLKSRRSSCLSSPDHSVLTLTDSENEHKTDEESELQVLQMLRLKVTSYRKAFIARSKERGRKTDQTEEVNGAKCLGRCLWDEGQDDDDDDVEKRECMGIDYFSHSQII
ncbi:Teneurin-2 [Anabarilius grahami]|uniref:Teneurin-2 n=1 Tax=Anabarilius grahami TaxID=495550 RepID=A0A3N0YPA3_ANAGA|nr:Teneurin-2 [Anabarilius grahami]